MFYRIDDFRIKTLAALALASTTSLLVAVALLIG